MATWKKIGKIGPPQGLHGSFVLVGGDPHEDFSDFSGVVMGRDPSCGIPVALDLSQYTGNQRVLKIRGINGRTELDTVRGQELWVPDLGEPEHELVGTQVLDATGTLLGTIESVQNHGASDIALIKTAQDKHIDLPLIPDFFVLPAADGKLELRVAQNTLADFFY